tara:strand:+ start:164 stop:265 length:102 start_codon:yes stop_codon:yes gene_type:complete
MSTTNTKNKEKPNRSPETPAQNPSEETPTKKAE